MKILSMNEVNAHHKSLIASFGNVFGVAMTDMVIESYQSKEAILSFDKPITHLRFLVEGRAKITLVHEDGNQTIINFIHPGEYVGELTFLEIEKEHKSIYAISECLLLAIDMTLAREKLGKDPDFLYELCQFIGNKVIDRSFFNSKNQNYELKYRLAAYILTTEHMGIYQEKHTETCEYLGVSYRHLLHTIKHFVEQGYLIKLKKGFKVNHQALKPLARDLIYR